MEMFLKGVFKGVIKGEIKGDVTGGGGGVIKACATVYIRVQNPHILAGFC